MSEIVGYPLCWPPAKARTQAYLRKHARFQTSFAQARNNLLEEIRRLGGTEPIFSSNIPRRNDGLPYSDAKPKNGDPGIAVYFKRKGKQLCFACDCYLTVDDNMHAISLTINALRGIARWGTGDMMEQAFTGFAALPAPRQMAQWWEVLGCKAHDPTQHVENCYRALVKSKHPDKGGSHDEFIMIQQAYESFRLERGLTT